jgi:sterol desaturase/sphingolipid hydroxylase (fatty acid hydroxylase superfamily)
MSEILFADEPLIRLATFAGVFAVMAAWELLAPRRDQKLGRGTRWPGNISIVVLDAILVRLVFPTSAVGLALVAEARQWGLFHAIDLPTWASVLLAVMALDLAIYLQHVLFHAIPVLWRLHRMHHADLEIDVTTGARFHPIEILLSMCSKLGTVTALGAPAAAVLAFEMLLNATSTATCACRPGSTECCAGSL